MRSVPTLGSLVAAACVLGTRVHTASAFAITHHGRVHVHVHVHGGPTQGGVTASTGAVARTHSTSLSPSSLSSAASAEVETAVVTGGEDDPRVLDVAAFRNGCINPEMIVARAEEKNAAVDKSEAALNGMKTGALYIGPVIAAGTYLQNSDPMMAASNYALFGFGVGALLAGNSLLGKSVHIPTLPEAKNRIIVDYSEGLLRQQDIGVVALSEDDQFEPCGGVMGAVDIQLRNSPNSRPGVRQIANYPSHLHIKNMSVEEGQRGKGVGTALMQCIEKYAKESTDAEMLTLEVRQDNPTAVRLYLKCGFMERENPQKMRVGNMFMVKELS